MTSLFKYIRALQAATQALAGNNPEMHKTLNNIPLLTAISEVKLSHEDVRGNRNAPRN